MENQNLLNRIKNFRIQKGFSQETLAEHSGLSVRTIQRMENSDSMPNADSLKKVSVAFGISIEELSKNTRAIYDLQYLKALNLSALSTLIFAFWWGSTNPIILILSCFVPAIMWVWKKDQIEGIDTISKTIINTKLTWGIFAFALTTFIYMVFTPHILPLINRLFQSNIESFHTPYSNNYILGSIIVLNAFLVLSNTFRIHSKQKLRSFIKINIIR
ncbi:helix-turn-helix domain-containing protein [Zunongwangia pacifica]|uniref:Helix-turn-helix domain-containing protein n=1 Tax=Zunongwangia pacifica TaxID=2911062 RepID=A0A9X1ZZG4_9FLAO|nr:helix-turn-helix transcriptional regulator [Zunongwangia pacifica]MCL6217354.1 helix-turn-helix domain-containing protein [Zunongwangia pacifica]